MSEAEIAWVAGIIEGEGCISRRKRQVQVIVSMNDGDVVHRLRSVTGLGSVVWKHAPSMKRGMWTWNVGSKHQAYSLLTQILPWLGARRRAAALEAIENILARGL